MMVHKLHSPWRKSAIMPIWSFQLALISIDLIIAILLMSITTNAPDQTVSSGGKTIIIHSGKQSWDIANLAISLISLILTCAEIVLYVHHDLAPKLYLGSSTLKVLLWTVVVALDGMAFRSNWEKGSWNNYILYVVIGFGGAVYITLLVGVGYGVVVFKRHRGTIARNVDKFMGLEG